MAGGKQRRDQYTADGTWHTAGSSRSPSPSARANAVREPPEHDGAQRGHDRRRRRQAESNLIGLMDVFDHERPPVRQDRVQPELVDKQACPGSARPAAARSPPRRIREVGCAELLRHVCVAPSRDKLSR